MHKLETQRCTSPFFTQNYLMNALDVKEVPSLKLRFGQAIEHLIIQVQRIFEFLFFQICLRWSIYEETNPKIE